MRPRRCAGGRNACGGAGLLFSRLQIAGGHLAWNPALAVYPRSHLAAGVAAFARALERTTAGVVRPATRELSSRQLRLPGLAPPAPHTAEEFVALAAPAHKDILVLQHGPHNPQNRTRAEIILPIK